MWQAANPNAWLSAEDDQTELIPFRYRYDGDKYKESWTSEHCRSLLSLGYTYPDIPLIYNKKTLEERVNELYLDPPKPLPALSRAPSGSENPALDIAEYLVVAKYET